MLIRPWQLEKSLIVSATELMYVPKSVQFKGGMTLYDLELLYCGQG